MCLQYWTERQFRPTRGFIMLCTMEMPAIENDTAQLGANHIDHKFLVCQLTFRQVMRSLHRDGCVAPQILRLCQARLFFTIHRGKL